MKCGNPGTLTSVQETLFQKLGGKLKNLLTKCLRRSGGGSFFLTICHLQGCTDESPSETWKDYKAVPEVYACARRVCLSSAGEALFKSLNSAADKLMVLLLFSKCTTLAVHKEPPHIWKKDCLLFLKNTVLMNATVAILTELGSQNSTWNV